MATKLMLIGGFLGAGKTTLISTLAETLKKDGNKVAIVTNDQAPSLVDTVFLAKSNDLVEEVSGSCFCCNYNGFIKSVDNLAEERADFILAEPVGSCTDLSATILQPVKKNEKGRIDLLAFSALIDPDRLETLLNNENEGLHPSALYIMRKQLEEADIIVISKIDKLQKDYLDTLVERTKKDFPGKPVLTVSAFTGAGIDSLLETVRSIKTSGSSITEVDYDTYAEGEAVLGWLNMETALKKPGADWKAFAMDLLGSIADECEAKKIPVAHIKLFIEGNSAQIIGNLTGKKDTMAIRGTAPKGEKVTLILNARAQTAPETLQNLVNQTLDKCCAKEKIENTAINVNCLMPGRPNPTHRYSEVVN